MILNLLDIRFTFARAHAIIIKMGLAQFSTGRTRTFKFYGFEERVNLNGTWDSGFGFAHIYYLVNRYWKKKKSVQSSSF